MTDEDAIIILDDLTLKKLVPPTASKAISVGILAIGFKNRVKRVIENNYSTLEDKLNAICDLIKEE